MSDPDRRAVKIEPVWKYGDAVPAGLSARWASVDSDELLLKDFARSMAAAGGVLMVVAGVTSVAVGYGQVWISLCCSVFGLAALLAALRSHRKDTHSAGAISAGEIDLVLEHRSLVGFGDWTLLPAHDLPREVAAARRAAGLAEQVRTLPAWSSGSLATHRLRLNPTEEARLLQLACREIYDHRQFMRSQAATTDGALRPTVEAAVLAWEDRLETTWVAVQDRLSAFEHYVEELLEVAVLLEADEVARRLSDALIDHEPALAVSMVGHEMAVDHLQRLRAELTVLREELTGS